MTRFSHFLISCFCAFFTENSSKFFPAMENKSLRSDLGSLSKWLHFLPDTESAEIVTKAVMCTIICTMTACLDAIDDSHILDLFIKIAKGLESFRSACKSDMLFKSESQEDVSDVHFVESDCNQSPLKSPEVNSLIGSYSEDEFSAEDEYETQIVKAEDESSEGLSLRPDVSSQRSSDSEDEYFSCSEYFPILSIEDIVESKFKTKAFYNVSEVLTQSVKIKNTEDVKSATASEALNIAAVNIVETFTIDLCRLLDFAWSSQMDVDDISKENLRTFARDSFHSVMYQINRFLLNHQQALAEIRDILNDNQQEDTAVCQTLDVNKTTSELSEVQLPQPTGSLAPGTMETNPDIRATSSSPSSSSLQENQKTTKKRLKFKMPKLRNPFKVKIFNRSILQEIFTCTLE